MTARGERSRQGINGQITREEGVWMLLACTAGPAERFREWEGCILRVDSGLGPDGWPTTNSSRSLFGRGPTASGKRKDGRKVEPKRIGNRRGSSLLWKTPSTRYLNRSKRQKRSLLSQYPNAFFASNL